MAVDGEEADADEARFLAALTEEERERWTKWTTDLEEARAELARAEDIAAMELQSKVTHLMLKQERRLGALKDRRMRVNREMMGLRFVTAERARDRERRWNQDSEAYLAATERRIQARMNEEEAELERQAEEALIRRGR